jgi:hypothetical protein
MTSVLRIVLPKDVVDIIKLYTGEGQWRNGKYIHIHRISASDPRYSVLSQRPVIKQVHNDHSQHQYRGCVWFKLPTGKFMVIGVREGYEWREWFGNFEKVEGHFWELNYNQEKTLLYLR